MRCMFLMPCIAITALLLLLAPTTHTEGPAYLLPVNRRIHRQYTPPLRHRHGYSRGPNLHGYQIWQPGLLLLYIACFFHTPTAPITGEEPLLPRTCVHHHGYQPSQHTVQQQLGPPMRRCTPQPRTPQDIPAPERVPECAGTPRSVARHRGICTTPGGQHKSTV